MYEEKLQKMEEEGTDALEVAAQENEKAQESKTPQGLIFSSLINSLHYFCYCLRKLESLKTNIDYL